MPTLLRAVALIPLALAPCLGADPGSPVRVGFQSEGRGTRYGNLDVAGDRIAIEVDDTGPVEFSPEELQLVDFHFPKGDPSGEPPPVWKKGSTLSPPWKYAAVGRLVAGGSARSDPSGRLHLFTSARYADDPFRSYSMTYREGPEDGHITARVLAIGDRDHESRAGVVIRDGTGRDSGNFLLVLHSGRGAGFRAWRSISSGYGGSEFGGGIRPPYWVRLVRDRGKMTALISPDGHTWTLVHEIEEASILGERRKGDALKPLYGLAATCSNTDSPWAATFDNIRVGPLEEVAKTSATKPRIYLTDGSMIRAECGSSEGGKLTQIGRPWERNLPSQYVARVEFFNPIVSSKSELLAEQRPGVLLTGGDFFEADFTSLTDGSIKVSSPLLGSREFEANSTADAVVLRKTDPEPGRRASLKVELLDGQIHFAKSFRVEKGKFLFDTTYLGERSLPVQSLQRISRIDLER